ncbi:MAG: translocation/assembly module TamB domain-containing protein, partial [Verrucomicrobiales bacterium]
TGFAEIDLKVRGTLKEPDWNGAATLRIDNARLSAGPISDFRDSTIRADFNRQKVTFGPTTLKAAGGEFKLSGDIALAEEPTFDLRLVAQNALLWRNEMFSLRSDANLSFTGPLSATRLSGELALVESLVYKDIEILPTKLDNNGTPAASLPSFDTGGPFSTGLAPPWGDCQLDVRLRTKDPILVRGNIARGQITGDTRIGGTLAVPRASGKVTVEELTASLPFSKLTISRGTITLRPEALTDPFINLRGTSRIDPYDLQLYLSGSVSNPQTSFSSSPPLPEHEIMTLIATGSTTSDLEDQSLASQKALQYLIEGLRRRYADPDSNNPFQRLLRNADQIELNLGESDLLSGRRFTSASVELTERIGFTAAMDDKGSRGTFSYSFRFK